MENTRTFYVLFPDIIDTKYSPGISEHGSREEAEFWEELHTKSQEKWLEEVRFGFNIVEVTETRQPIALFVNRKGTIEFVYTEDVYRNKLMQSWKATIFTFFEEQFEMVCANTDNIQVVLKDLLPPEKQ